MAILALLILAAGLEIGGDAAMRHGLAEARWLWLVLGAATLAFYGLVVNANRALEFGKLMGLYIAVFFVVSQVVAFATFGERPSGGLVVGGALIVAGGVVVHLTAR
jgi:drug/metabolite transporter superfamily protein YnfA